MTGPQAMTASTIEQDLRPNREFEADELVNIRAGETTAYKVSKATLLAASPWFQKALSKSNGFKESSENAITFPEEDAVAVKIFLLWLLKRKIPAIHDLPVIPLDGRRAHKGNNLCSNYTGSRYVEELAKSWIFGDAHFLPTFQDSVMKSLQKCVFRHDYYLDIVIYVYENTSEGSKLRKLFVMEIARGTEPPGGGEGAYEYTFPELKRAGLMGVPDFCSDLFEIVARQEKPRKAVLADFLVEVDKSEQI